MIKNTFYKNRYFGCCNIAVILVAMILIQAVPVSAQSFTTTPMIAVGESYSIALKSDGTVWAWGRNYWGNLGDGTTASRHFPVQVLGLTNVIAISAGMGHSVALKSDGTVWAWGGGVHGEIGNETILISSIPLQVIGLSGISAISAGDGYTIALKSNGTVWAWGDNHLGQLGDGNTAITNRTPVQVIGLSGVSAISAGGSHTMALKTDGTVWTWGSNLHRQLGDGTYTDRFTPVQVQGLSGVSAITAGRDHSVALKSDGTVWAWGDNRYRQLGDGTTTERHTIVQVLGLSSIDAISAGFDQSIALKQDGTVWTWGFPWGWIGSVDGFPAEAPDLSGVSAIAAGITLIEGRGHFIALKSDGSVWAWGSNNYGQLGDETLTDRNSPIQVLGVDGMGYLNLGATSPPSATPSVYDENEKITTYLKNDVLYVSGLKAGTSWNVYSIDGRLIYQDVAADDNAEVLLPPGRGMYVVTNGSKTVKIIK